MVSAGDRQLTNRNGLVNDQAVAAICSMRGQVDIEVSEGVWYHVGGASKGVELKLCTSEYDVGAVRNCVRY